MSEDWTREEVEILVAEYFEMLAKEQAGIAYNKAETRRRILPLLKNRTDGSLEFKNRNISAVLAKIGQPYNVAIYLLIIIRKYCSKMWCSRTYYESLK